MILELARGHIRYGFEGKEITVQGEAYLPGYGSPDFVIYSNSIEKWDPPNESITIDAKTKERILEALVREMKARGMNVEVT